MLRSEQVVHPMTEARILLRRSLHGEYYMLQRMQKCLLNSLGATRMMDMLLTPLTSGT